MIFTHFGVLIKTVRTDNGPEFNMPYFFEEHGIIHQRSCAYTPQQNAVVEREHQHILNVALRFQASPPLEFWGNYVMHAVYVINRLPSPYAEFEHDVSPSNSATCPPEFSPLIPRLHVPTVVEIESSVTPEVEQNVTQEVEQNVAPE
nr:Integrase, catalytic core [Ipomoea batatas]